MVLKMFLKAIECFSNGHCRR